MDVSIVIPVFNKSGLTRVCLNALHRTIPRDIQTEVIVIDNHSTDDTQSVLRDFPWIKLVTNQTNLGFAGANNQGAALASGELLLLLNNDTEPQDGWLRAMVDTARQADVGITGARLLFANRTLQHAGVVVWPARFGTYQYIPYHFLWSSPARAPAAMLRRDFQIVTGACLMTPLALYRELGGLDEAYWNGYEDVDYCFKVLQHGKRVVYEPDAELFHYESQSGPLRFSRVAYNSTLLARRWPHFPKIDHVQRYLSAGNIRRTYRVANKFSTMSLLAPHTTVVVHGGELKDGKAFAARLTNTLAPIERVVWTLNSPPPAMGRIAVQHRAGDALGAAQAEMQVRGDRYLAFVDSGTELEPNWLDALLEATEWGTEVVGATTSAELPPARDVVPIAADARCTVLSLRQIPQHESLREFDTLGGSVADLSLRMLPYEFALRAAADPVGRTPALAADPAFEAAHGHPVAHFLRDDPAYVETALTNRAPRALASLKASIVMLSWNAPAYTKIAVESIRKHTKMDYEIVIVDNGSGPDTTAWLREQEGMTVVYNATNRGFAAGCNQGIAAATGDYIVLLNNDVVVTDGWLETLVEAVERDPATGVSAPRSNEIAGDQKLLDLKYNALEEMHEIARRRSLDFVRSGYYTDRAIGFCLCIDRTVIDQIGGIDETFGTGNFEDDDFCMRVRAAGYRIYVCNDVFIHHFGSVSFQTNAVDYASTMYKNWAKFSAKWGYPAQYPANGYDPQQAIRAGFNRAKHYFPIPGYGAPRTQETPPSAPGADRVHVLIAAVVKAESDWNTVGSAVRRYVQAFGAGDSATFAIVCTGDLAADTIGARIAKTIEKTGADPEASADVIVSDESDAATFLQSIAAEHRFAVDENSAAVCGFEVLTARSPSDLRRLYQSLAPGNAPA